MNEIWTKKWKAVLLWLCGYLNIIAYVLVGGYIIVKSEDNELKKEAKTALIVTLIFTAISAFLLIINQCGGMSDNYYNSGLYNFHDMCNRLVNIAKVVVYAVFVLIALCKKESAGNQPKADNAPAADKTADSAAAKADDTVTADDAVTEKQE